MRKEGIADGYVGRRHAAQGEEEHEVDVRGEVAARDKDHRHYFFWVLRSKSHLRNFTIGTLFILNSIGREKKNQT